jgi:hypothetical protein
MTNIPAKTEVFPPHNTQNVNLGANHPYGEQIIDNFFTNSNSNDFSTKATDPFEIINNNHIEINQIYETKEIHRDSGFMDYPTFEDLHHQPKGNNQNINSFFENK